jgi:hypothetical protein
MLSLVLVAILIALWSVFRGSAVAAQRSALQSATSLERRLVSRVVASVPADDAELVVNDEAIGGTVRRGRSKHRRSPPPTSD